MQERMRELVDTLNSTAYAYYTAGTSPLSDKQWDELYDELTRLEKESGIFLPDSPTHRVGGAPLSGFEQHTHINRLWSMDKVQSEDEFHQWYARTQKAFGDHVPPFYIEYKFDGLTINLTYENGILVQAATRGNGEVGEAILPQAKTIRTVPLSIPYKGRLEVQGECIMRLSSLEAYNKTAAEPLKNARNAAAGALRNLDPQLTASRKLDAFFYQVGTIDDPPYHDQKGMLQFLRENGFPVADFLGEAKTEDGIIEAIRAIEKQRDSLDWLIDGAVIKIGDFSLRDQMGYTEKFPRWAVAFKFEAQESITKLLDVTWELGRTGKLTPLAHLEPVDFYGVTVKKATLNNFGDIQRKQVAIGCQVRVRRSNDVIPEILGREGEPSPDEREITLPEVCPSCGKKLVLRGAHIFCMNRLSCKPQAVARIAHFASRDAMDIDGLSEKTADQLYDRLSVRDMADLYRLKAEEMHVCDGFSISKSGVPGKKTQNLMAALEKSKHCTLDAFLYAIGIPNIGRKTARDIAQAFRTLDNVMDATEEQLVQIPEIGDTIAQSVTEFFSFEENREMIRRLLESGVAPQSMAAREGGPFEGMSIVVTGTLPTLSRKEAEELIRENGGSAASSVSKKTAFVVAGEAAGSKLDKATKLGIEVIDEAAFLERCADH